MRKSMRRWMTTATIGLAALAASAGAQAYSNLYIFGDSLSDTGNIFALTGGATPAAPYFAGRFSDGPVWAETLATSLGLPAASTASLLGGQNFAFVGYLPQDAAARAARIRELEAVSRRSGQTQIAIETPYRNAALLQALVDSLQASTRLCVASGITLPGAWNRSDTVAGWRQGPAAPLHSHTPAVFAWLA